MLIDGGCFPKLIALSIHPHPPKNGKEITPPPKKVSEIISTFHPFSVRIEKILKEVKGRGKKRGKKGRFWGNSGPILTRLDHLGPFWSKNRDF